MSQSLSQVVSADHAEVYTLHESYLVSKGDVNAQAQHALMLGWAVGRHAMMEEILMHPLQTRAIPGQGAELAAIDAREHEQIKEMLMQLASWTEGHGPGTIEFDNLLETMMGHLRRHNDSEESADLPLLDSHLGPEGSARAAEMFGKVKQFMALSSAKTNLGVDISEDGFGALKELLECPTHDLKEKVEVLLNQ